MGKLNYTTASINSILASVADKAELTEVAKKADKTYVDTELAKKQGKLTAGTGIKIEGNTISSTGGGGGGGGTTDYTQLENKPSINGVTLDGEKSLDELGIQGKTIEKVRCSFDVTDTKFRRCVFVNQGETIRVEGEGGIVEMDTNEGGKIYLVAGDSTQNSYTFSQYGFIYLLKIDGEPVVRIYKDANMSDVVYEKDTYDNLVSTQTIPSNENVLFDNVRSGEKIRIKYDKDDLHIEALINGIPSYISLDSVPFENHIDIDIDIDDTAYRSVWQVALTNTSSYDIIVERYEQKSLTDLSAKVGKIKLTPADLPAEDGVYMLDLTSDALKYKSVVVDFTGASDDATICALICDESGAPVFEGEAAIYCKGGAFIGTDSESAKVYGSTPDWDSNKTYLCVIADNSVVYAEEEAAE